MEEQCYSYLFKRKLEFEAVKIHRIRIDGLAESTYGISGEMRHKCGALSGDGCVSNGCVFLNHCQRTSQNHKFGALDTSP